MKININIERTRLNIEDNLPRTSCHGPSGIRAFGTGPFETGRESITISPVDENGNPMAELSIYGDNAARKVIEAIEAAIAERDEREARFHTRVAA